MRTATRLVATITAKANQVAIAGHEDQRVRTTAAKNAELACPLGKLEVRGLRILNRESPLTVGRSRLKKRLDALVQDHALDAHQRRKNQRLFDPRIVGNGAHDTDNVPQHAEITECSRRCEQPNCWLEIARGFEQAIKVGVERDKSRRSVI